MLLLKLTIVPLFIALVTLAGKKWGAQLAGLLGGLPVVAGPIVVFLAMEQGQAFGVVASTSAIASVVALLAFGLAYSWLSLSNSWPVTYVLSLLVWLTTAALLAQLTLTPFFASVLVLMAIVLTPALLPKVPFKASGASSLKDLPLRLISGAILTLAVTQSAQLLGGSWSGILAVFPVIGSVLAIFTHRNQGAAAVTQLYRGMVKGLCWLSLFFLILTFAWQRYGFWWPVLIAIFSALGLQLLFRLPSLLKMQKIANATGN
ncbi:hypothetical protein [Alkanindiges illinoisensis]|uniref:hypothetical protein n=1 Tax=Alkanindiges illinoisensis TaxID=197183 RepID=UPI000479D78B|nr:hypothetical protein [Alkanindiges illinoisensis]